MKTNILLLFVLFFTIKSIESQELNLYKSEVFKDIGRDSELAFYDEDNSGNLFVLRKFYSGVNNSKKIYLIEHYNSALKKIKSKEFFDKEIKQFFVKNGYIHLILLDNKENSNKYYYKIMRSPVEEFNFESFQLSLDKDIQVAGKDHIEENSFSKDFFHQPYDNYNGEVVLSKNKNFIGLSVQEHNKQNETHHIAVFDLSFKKIFENKIQQDLKDRRYEFNSFIVDDVDGTAYFLGKYNPNLLQKIDLGTEVIFNFNLFKINKDSQKVIEFKTGDNFISSLKLLETEEKLICAGLYSSSSSNSVKGVAYYQIGKDHLNIKKSNFLELGNKKIKKLNLRKLLVDKDENLYVASEESYLVNTSEPTFQYSNQSFHFDNIHFAKINNQGILDWYYQFEKSQSNSRNGFVYFSYIFNLIDNTPYLIFNADQKKILKGDELKIKSTSLNKMFLYTLVFDQEGKYNIRLLDKDKSDKITFKTFEGLINENSFLLEGEFRGKKQILKINKGINPN